MAEPSDPTTPRIKLTGLHIAGYRSLRRVDWPEDGLGWDGQVPDTVLVGGLNGSGKTTLLELIFGLTRFMLGNVGPLKEIATSLGVKGHAQIDVRMLVGWQEESLSLQGNRLQLAERWSSVLSGEKSPRLLYFPTDRAVLFPATDFKGPGRHKQAEGPVYRYSPPSEWLRSIEALLYEARWRDLQALAQGKPIPGHFAAFERVMQRFFAGAKQLHWDDDGELHIKTKDGALHGLEALSSGEKQVLLFGAELVERWTPGSLVLIDEPELHLHEAWLAALWELIGELQRERGGQVIVATQSNYLFGLGGLGTQVLLGGWKP